VKQQREKRKRDRERREKEEREREKNKQTNNVSEGLSQTGGHTLTKHQSTRHT
jgi:hypothetical protein